MIVKFDEQQKSTKKTGMDFMLKIIFLVQCYIQ
jgi:hypothetical protein